MDAETVWIGLGGLGTFVAALASAYVLIRKYGPEVNKIQIESANAVVEMAKTAAGMSAATAEDLRKRNEALDARLTELAQTVGAQIEKIAELERKAVLVDELYAEVEREREEKLRLAAENRLLTKRVSDLERELALLQQREGFRDNRLDDEHPDL